MDQASAAALPELRIWCLGGFRATLGGSPVVFETDKGRALLAYLAVEAGQPQRRERLAGLLWSDQPEDKALHNLRQTLGGLRKALGEEPARHGDSNQPLHTSLLLVQRETLQLNPARCTWLDVRQFQQVLQDALYFYAGSSVDSTHRRGRLNLRLLERALDLYGGGFLERLQLEGSPLFDEWALSQRELYHQQAVGALELLAELRERRGEIALARQAAEHLAALMPWNESACSRLVNLYAQEGMWDAAYRQKQAFQHYLHHQLGLHPSDEIASLFEHINQAAAKGRSFPARYPMPRHNLPAQPSTVVVSSAALDNISMLLADPGCRLLSLVGLEGSGKTQLALAAAHLQVGMFADGVFFVPLDAQTGPISLAEAIASALGLDLKQAQDPYLKILEYLYDREMLLVIDGCEEALAAQAGACMDFLAAVLQQAAQVKLVVTSQAALNLRSECVLEVDET